MINLDSFLTFKHPEWREVLPLQRNSTQSTSQYWSSWRGWNARWSSAPVRATPPHPPNTTHAHTHIYTAVLSSDSWVGQRTYISFEIKIFEDLRIDLVFLESSVLRRLRVAVKILVRGRVKLAYDDSRIVFIPALFEQGEWKSSSMGHFKKVISH